MPKFLQAVGHAAKDFADDECMTSGAAIAYYTIFSLPPLLVAVFFIARQFGVPQETVDRFVKDQVGMPIPVQQPRESGEEQDTVVGRLGPVGKAIGVGVLLFSATGVFAQLQFALNRAWEVEQDPRKGGILRLVTKRALSLGMVVVIAFLLLVSLVVTTVIDELLHLFLGESPGTAGVVLGESLNTLATLAVATVLFAAMYKVLPDARMRWSDTWIGAGMTAVLFVVGKALIALYLDNADMGSSWGAAAASMIAMLVWVYYTALIVLFGAELTQAWTAQYGAGIEPSPGAVRIVEEKHRLERRPP